MNSFAPIAHGLCALCVLLSGCMHGYRVDGKISDKPSPELAKFWEEELEPWIEKELLAAKLPYPKINARILDCNSVIAKEYGRTVWCRLSSRYHSAGKRIEGSAGDVSRPDSCIVYLILPALRDRFEELERIGFPGWRDAFKNHVIVIFMHEMEHLRYLLKNGRDPKQRHIDLAEESRAWDETCRYTLDPLIREHRATMIMGDWEIYDAWLKAGRDRENALWKDKMTQRHASVDARW